MGIFPLGASQGIPGPASRSVSVFGIRIFQVTEWDHAASVPWFLETNEPLPCAHTCGAWHCPMHVLDP